MATFASLRVRPRDKAIQYLADVHPKPSGQAFSMIVNEIEKVVLKENEIKRQVKQQLETTLETGKDWIHCWNECYATTKKQMKREVRSTAFMLRLLSKSMITAATETAIKNLFVFQDGNYTGVWKNDRNFIALNIPKIKPRLIMGFGPSASGKTFWAKNVISLMKLRDYKNFPASFLAVDGGIAREESFVYQLIVDTINSLCRQPTCVKGFQNLVAPGIPSVKELYYNLRNTSKPLPSIFVKSKSALKSYIKMLDVKPSLYVPDTASSGAGYKKWQKLLGDASWIALYIWQHRTQQQCTFPRGFQCLGCQASGQAREVKEGKRYSAAAYGKSEVNGRAYLMSAPGARIDIHNGGGLKQDGAVTTSTMTEHPIRGSYKFTEQRLTMFINNLNSLGPPVPIKMVYKRAKPMKLRF